MKEYANNLIKRMIIFNGLLVIALLVISTTLSRSLALSLFLLNSAIVIFIFIDSRKY